MRNWESQTYRAEVVDFETKEVMHTFTATGADMWEAVNNYATGIGASVHDDIVPGELPSKYDDRALYVGIGFWDGTGADVYVEMLDA